MNSGFFAIGKPQWSAACDLGLNPSVALLVMARGTGRDNATTAWSAHAVERHSGMSWRRAHDAVGSLLVAKIATQTKKGARPSYKIEKPKEPAGLIWLPNEIVTGAGDEIAPVMRLRQTAEPEVLRVFVDLYAEHDLVGDGGIPRDLIYQVFDRELILNVGQYDVFGFNRPEHRYCNSVRALSRFAATKKGAPGAWDYLTILENTGLLQRVDYLAESNKPDAELIHALSGDSYAQAVADAAQEFVDALPDCYQHGAERYLYALPVPRHMRNAAVVSVWRLHYRPKTKATATWLAKHAAACDQFAAMYRETPKTGLEKAA